MTLSALVAVLTAFALRTRLPGPVVFGLLAAAGAALGWGGILLRPDPSAIEHVLIVIAMSLLVPLHVRVVLGPLGRRGESA